MKTLSYLGRTKDGGYEYLHHFGTGYQFLVFAMPATAEAFAKMNGAIIE